MDGETTADGQMQLGLQMVQQAYGRRAGERRSEKRRITIRTSDSSRKRKEEGGESPSLNPPKLKFSSS